MKRLASAVAVALGCLAPAMPADAAVLEITTTIATADAHDPSRLQAAVDGAIRSALDDARATRASPPFIPTHIVITRAVTIGERTYVRIVVSDTPPRPTPNDI